MIVYDFGTILLLRFPYTGLQSSPKRPALVVYDEGDQDIIVARITSQPYSGKNDFEIVNWKQTGLIFPSWIRLGKLATLEKGTVDRVVGKLAQGDCAKIKGILVDMFKA